MCNPLEIKTIIVIIIHLNPSVKFPEKIANGSKVIAQTQIFGEGRLVKKYIAKVVFLICDTLSH